MNDEQYSMIQVDESGCDRGPLSWVIYPKGGSYFKDELVRIPGGSEVKDRAARKVLDAMNR